MIVLLTRAYFLGRIVLLAAGGLSAAYTSLPARPVVAEMAKSPDYGVWEAVLKAHVKPTTIRGIPVNAVDYEGAA